MGETPTITFRKMTAEDAEQVAEIDFKSFSVPWKMTDYWRYAQEKNIEAVVGEMDKKIVAYAAAFVSFDEAEVFKIAVEPELRGLGFGTKIFSALIEVCKKRGANKITLEVRPSNIAAVKMYESFGLRSVGRRKNYYTNPVEDALIMWNTKLDS